MASVGIFTLFELSLHYIQHDIPINVLRASLNISSLPSKDLFIANICEKELAHCTVLANLFSLPALAVTMSVISYPVVINIWPFLQESIKPILQESDSQPIFTN